MTETLFFALFLLVWLYVSIWTIYHLDDIEANIARVKMLIYITLIWPFNYKIDGWVVWEDEFIIYVKGGDKVFYE